MASSLSQKKTRVLVKNVQGMREKRQLSEEDLAGKIGKARTYIYGLEAGNFTPSLSILVRLAIVLRCKVSDLVRNL